MIVYFNHNKKQCGVYQFGKRHGEILSRYIPDFIYKEISSQQEHDNILKEFNPSTIIYNYNRIFNFLFDKLPDLHKQYKIFAISHEGHNNHFQRWIHPDPTFQEYSNHFRVGRCLIKNNAWYPINNIISIGSFGFPTPHKNFHKIVEMANNELESAYVTFLIPPHDFSDHNNTRYDEYIKMIINSNKNPNIMLSFKREFLDDEELLGFLASNDINMFMYENRECTGVASVLDYALSVKRPVITSNISMFRHINKTTQSIKEAINLGVSPFQQYYNDWTEENLVNDFKRIFNVL